MTSAHRWLDSRTPPPPGELRAAVESAPGLKASSEALGASAAERLVTALARPGRVRESAFELLAADALITYACEAAIEGEEPERALRVLAARLSRAEAPG